MVFICILILVLEVAFGALCAWALVWTVLTACGVVVPESEAKAMLTTDGQQRPRVWKFVLSEAGYGLIAGAIGGPILVWAWMFVMPRLYPSMAFGSSGFEVPMCSVAGAILGTLEGPLFGLLWAIKPPKMTIWWLMVAVATVGLILSVFRFEPLLGVFVSMVPIMMFVLTRLAAVIRATSDVYERQLSRQGL